MPSNQDKTPWVGRQSGKSSARWFGGAGRGMHPRGNGASTGDGRTDTRSTIGKIIPKFLRGNR